MLEYELELVSVLFGIVGKDGGITVNVGLSDHYYFGDDSKLNSTKVGQGDLILLGKKGKKVSVADVKKLIVAIKKHVDLYGDQLEEDRSYFFEGISKIDEYNYTFNWGS